MRILHVVTLHSADNAFGGPVRVALNLANELIRRGHEVELLGLERGFSATPTSVEGVSAQLFPARRILPFAGFSWIANIRLFLWFLRNRRHFDLIHTHLARDLVTLPVALIALVLNKTYVLQTHGMVDPSPRLLAKILDLLAVRRVLRRASAVLFLTEREHEDLLAVEPRLTNLHFLPNGVQLPSVADLAQERRTISFIGRLQSRKNPRIFVEACAEIAAQALDHSFVLAGPDEGEGTGTRAAIHESSVQDRIEYVGSLQHDAVLELLRKSSVMVLPSVDEPFPMSVVEALSLGVPCVVTHSCGLATHIADAKAGAVCEPDPASVAQATLEVLADLPGYSVRARRLAEQKFSIDAVVSDLLAVYQFALRQRSDDN